VQRWGKERKSQAAQLNLRFLGWAAFFILSYLAKSRREDFDFFAVFGNSAPGKLQMMFFIQYPHDILIA